MEQEELKKQEELGKVVEEEKKEPAEPTTQAEPKEVNNKYAEGARKATKKLLEDLNLTSVDELKEIVNAGRKTKEVDIDTLNAKVICSDLNVKKSYRDDVIAIVKGKGLEINEENIKAVLDKHKEWAISDDDNKAGLNIKVGEPSGKQAPEGPSEIEQARSLFK